MATAAMRLAGVAFAADASTDAGAELARANEPCMPPALARAAQDPAGVEPAGTVSRSLLVIVARAGASADSLESAFESAGVFRDAKPPPLLKVGDPARDAAADAARRLRLHRSRCTSFSSAKISAHSSLVTRSLSNAQKTPPGVLRLHSVAGHLSAVALDAVHLDGDVVSLDDADAVERAAH